MFADKFKKLRFVEQLQQSTDNEKNMEKIYSMLKFDANVYIIHVATNM